MTKDVKFARHRQMVEEAASLHAQGRLAEAERRYRSILKLDPRDFNSLHLLGVIRTQQGRYTEAVKLIGDAIRACPTSAEAYSNLASALLALNRYAEAVASCRSAVRLRPDYADAHNNLGLGLQRMSQFDEAIACHRRAIAIDASHATAYNNLGLAFETVGQTGAALAQYREAVALKPDYAEALNNLGNVLQSFRNYPEAIACYERAIASAPEYAEAHWNLGLAHLTLGDYSVGWREYEWRWRTLAFARERRNFSLRNWDGRDNLHGRRILLYGEQGFGDAIQFVRYAALVAGRGARVVLECRPPLKRLFEGVEGVEQTVSTGERRPPFHFHCSLLSLPHIFRTTLDTIPAPAAYLRAPADSLAKWQAVLGERHGMRVGLAWSGNPAHRNDRNRSINLRRLAPILSVPGVQFVSVQTDLREDDARALQSFPNLRHLGEKFSDFADAACVVSQLDLVISVDTAVAHLAGALAKPVWVLLPHAPDWRWLLDRSESPWYPKMRLIRQSCLGDWETPLHEARERLMGLSRSNAT